MSSALSDPTQEVETAFPLPYGPYLLLHKLARGGMGDVFLAKTAGTMGIEKHCVVKTLRSGFTHDPEYVQRFMEEARVVVQLSHRNICPVFDVGRIGPSYYLAMELVIGRDVRSLQVALEAQEKQLSEGCALHIIAEALEALDYAHRSVDATTGEPLHLVHRDVSPQNILINVEGEVKLIDFGLAERRRDVAEEVNTTATTVMGKMSYMAPEQARGDTVDARADQFAAAVVAFEIVTNERYYQGLTSQQVWQQAGAGEFRPAGMKTLHPLLRRVIEKALSPHREDRYATCGEFKDAILEYTRDRELHNAGKELRAITQELFAEDLKETRELLRRFTGTTPGVAMTPRASVSQEPSEVLSFASAPASLIHDPTEVFRRSTGFFERPPQRSRAPAIAAAVVALLLIAGLAGALFLREPVLQIVKEEPVVPVVPADQPLVAVPAPGDVPLTAATADAGVAANGSATVATTKEPMVDESNPGSNSGRRTGRTGRTSPPPTPPPSKIITLDRKFALLKKCKDPCAPRMLVYEGKMADIPLEQLKSTKDFIERCYERCKAPPR